jgi:DAACS family dicarboxylate/amino acid:cation (Na+ or H+) symporter
VVVPLVFSSLALGIVQLGQLDQLGPLAADVRPVRPQHGDRRDTGIADHECRPARRPDGRDLSRLLAEFRQAPPTLGEGRGGTALNLSTMVDMFFPWNLARAVVDFEMLPLIAFALLLGIAGTQLRVERDGAAARPQSLRSHDSHRPYA